MILSWIYWRISWCNEPSMVECGWWCSQILLNFITTVVADDFDSTVQRTFTRTATQFANGDFAQWCRWFQLLHVTATRLFSFPTLNEDTPYLVFPSDWEYWLNIWWTPWRIFHQKWLKWQTLDFVPVLIVEIPCSDCVFDEHPFHNWLKQVINWTRILQCEADTIHLWRLKALTESRHIWCKNFHLKHLVNFYRIGEAKNPGPPTKEENLNTVCVYNPSGMHNKHLFFLEHLQQGISWYPKPIDLKAQKAESYLYRKNHRHHVFSKPTRSRAKYLSSQEQGLPMNGGVAI